RELVQIDLELRLARGGGASAAEYLVRFPQLVEDTRFAAELIAIERDARLGGKTAAGERKARGVLAPTSNVIQNALLPETAASSVLENPDTAPSIAPENGSLIANRYRLLRLLGEGGMGTVHVAEQLQPVRRRVALKLIKPGLDTNQVLA